MHIYELKADIIATDSSLPFTGKAISFLGQNPFISFLFFYFIKTFD